MAQIIEQWEGNIKFRYLKLETFETFGCTDDTVSVQTQFDNQTLKIILGEKPINNPCNFGRAPLVNKILLPSDLQSLSIQFVLAGNIISHGTIHETDDKYELRIEANKGIEIKHGETKKMKEQLIWGYVYPKSIDLANQLLAENFRLTIEESSINKNLEPGFYSYFSIGDDHKIKWEERPDILGNLSSFYYEHKLNEIQLASYLSELQSKYGNIIGYRVQTGKGQQIISQ